MPRSISCKVFLFLTLLIVIITSEEEDTDADLIDEYTKYQKNQTNSEPISMKIGVDKQNSTKTCRCVKYFECNAQEEENGNHSISNPNPTSGADGAEGAVHSGDILGIVDIRLKGEEGNQTTTNGCQHYFEICCKNVKNESEPSKVKESEESKLSIKDLTNWTHKECGHRNENGIGFQITGGTGGESQFSEFPWTVAIVKEDLGDDNVTKNVFLCGGSLLSPQVVATAAHCVFQLAHSSKKSQLKVRSGEWDTQTLDEPFAHQDRYVKKVVIHEELYRKGLFNDIALLFLETEVKLAPNIDTVCLPVGLDPSQFDGQSCFSSGWGKDNFGASGRYQEIMKKVEVPIIPRKNCESALRKTRLGDGFRLHDSFICAGGGQNDTCVGDGGSPLVCKMLNSRNYIQLGIVAWGISCGSNTPAVYVNLSKFVPWILNKMKENGIDQKYCTI